MKKMLKQREVSLAEMTIALTLTSQPTARATIFLAGIYHYIAGKYALEPHGTVPKFLGTLGTWNRPKAQLDVD